jgi:SAM-dependent methyltransferase
MNARGLIDSAVAMANRSRSTTAALGYLSDARAHLRASAHQGMSLTSPGSAPNRYGDVIAHFDAGSVRLPVFRRYRYDTKPLGDFYPSLGDLVELAARGLLTPDEKQFATSALGEFTIGAPLAEIAERLGAVADRMPEAFIWPQPGGAPVLKPTPAAIERRINRLMVRRQRQLRGLRMPTDRGRPLRVLEIGFISGGYSLVAFERLGFDVTGLDNFYDGALDQRALPEHVVRDVCRSDVRLVIGDAASPTTLAGEQFDVIFSESVVEHLADPRATFSQFRRLLAPDGVMFHVYEPFFCPRGGHQPGTLDCPFGHVRLSPQDHLRYLAERRPLEAAIGVPWVEQSLNRLTQGEIQRELLGAGLEIESWTPDFVNPPGLSPEILDQCLAAYPGISINDLGTVAVSFAARVDMAA